jgi:hypothetical protein
MILIHMPSILSTTLRMKEGLAYLMVKLAYHLSYVELTGCDELGVKFGSVDNHSPMRGHMGHPEASQGDLENQPVL